jgi:hypothetical protein
MWGNILTHIGVHQTPCHPSLWKCLVAPTNPTVPLCCTKSLLASYFGCFVDLASVPWNHNVAYQWVFDVVICHEGCSQLLPRCLNCYY